MMLNFVVCFIELGNAFSQIQYFCVGAHSMLLIINTSAVDSQENEPLISFTGRVSGNCHVQIDQIQ